jgi:copper chaperone
MSTVTLKIQGMTCHHCVARVTKALKAIPGVQDAVVDLRKAEAAVSYDETRVDNAALSAAVTDAGYTVTS